MIYKTHLFLAILIAQTFTGEYVMSDSDVDKYLDHEKLKSYRIETTISGHYLKIWNIYLQYAKKIKSSIDIDNYLINFSENSNEYIIFFKKPAKQKIVGGGHGACKIDKKTMEIAECKFIK